MILKILLIIIGAVKLAILIGFVNGAKRAVIKTMSYSHILVIIGQLGPVVSV